ncbi:MAG: hypothetical protein ACRDOE_00150 [Streptosporangiaceae bacterium]
MARGFGLYDAVDLTKTCVADATGLATFIFDAVDVGHSWDVTFISVTSTSKQNGPCRMFLDDASPANFRGGTASGIGDVDTTASLIVPANRSLMFQWAQMTPVSVCTVALQYRDLIGVGYPSDQRLSAHPEATAL